MESTLPLACILSMIRPPSIQFENALLQIAPINKEKCPFVINDVSFPLYTRHNPTAPHVLKIDDDESLFSSSINFHDETVFIFLAFMETPDDGSALWLREAYTVRGDTNVIIVDSQRLQAGPWYVHAAHNTWYTGRIAAMFIDYLVSRGLNLSKTHLVGHSLGAQSAGVAGGTLQSGRVSRITGLDVALPLFSTVPLVQRLDASDAEFVDVIHSDAGIFGFNELVGDVDFFPNGGTSPQPGCELSVVLPQQLLLQDSTTKRKVEGYCVFHLRGNETDIPSKIGSIVSKAGTNNHVRKNLNSVTKKKEKLVDFETKKIPSESEDNETKKFSSENKENNLNIKFNPINILMKKKTKNGDKISKSFRLKKTLIPTNKKRRQRRFASFFKSEDNNNNLIKLLDFLVKSGKTIIPVISVIREINTLVKTSTGELNHMIKEQNNYIGTTATLPPVTYNIQFDAASKMMAFFKRMFGIGKEKVSLVA